ncbi:lipase maturation factor family protein [Alloacidobacterium sp.]|uniref:lipase maturation factor family protein n=1 Tax=Alloacidobacterium sp. TaxID=2951999 RepID=UPI002D756BDD|nr:lipase maturation factor family protein [Alloacidobacterium sp.]HYK35345.1 lipase maturation factor family protein [Alloacidobacterium sp.]
MGTSVLQRIFGPEKGSGDLNSSRSHLIPRWIFLRALGFIYFSAFYSLLFQIRGLVGPDGILPAHQYLQAVERSIPGLTRFWFAPSLFWFSTSNHALMTVTLIGLIASLLVIANVWPRLTLFICLVSFLSFVSAAGDFSNYQSDGMLLEAGFISLFFAPRGIWPGLGTSFPPSPASRFLLLWEWFRIYFESGLVKLLSGDQEWRHFTAMDEYYQNGPLPTWIGWYMQHLPHWFHAFTVGATLTMELVLVLMLFMPRRFRLVCFFIVTPWQIVVIATANYTFLNYLVLSQGFLLLNDKFLMRLAPKRFWPPILPSVCHPERSTEGAESKDLQFVPQSSDTTQEPESQPAVFKKNWRLHASAIRLAISAVLLSWIFYVTTAELIHMLWREAPLPSSPIAALEPFRIANQYGLFAVMTRGRYEIEFQGSNDGENWTAYPFRYKPQALNQPPGIYAPYQPRFDWNLWFASLGSWRQNSIVPLAEERLLTSNPDVLTLFAGNPFPQSPPKYVRAMLWQYWFTSMAQKSETGIWWRRELLGLYAPELTLRPDGTFDVVQWPEILPTHE